MSYALTVSGTSRDFAAGSLEIEDRVEERSTLRVLIYDAVGGTVYQKGEPIEVRTTGGRLVFGGRIETAQRTRMGAPGSGQLAWDVQAADDHYLADKRIVAQSWTGATVGSMVRDVLYDVLVPEGVTDANAVRNPNFEQNASYWSLPAAIVRNAWGALGTVWGLRCTPGGAGVYGRCDPCMAVRVGDVVTASIYVCGGDPGETLRLGFNGYDADGVNLWGTGDYLDFAGGLAGWYRKTLTWVVTQVSWDAGVRYLGVYVGHAVGTIGVPSFFDCIQLERGYRASPYLDSSIEEGPTIVSYLSNYEAATHVLGDMADLSGYTWFIFDRVLYFQSRVTTVAPWELTGADALSRPAPARSEESPSYRNRQYIKGFTAVTDPFTEQYHGDGKRTSFALGFPVHSVPTVTVNGAAKLVGIKGVDKQLSDDPGGKEWFWSKGDPIITQDNGGTVLLTTDTLAVTYAGEYNAVVLSEDAAAQADRFAIEGTGTGIVEAVEDRPQEASADQALERAGYLLAKYAQLGSKLKFATHRAGLRAGQLLTVDLAELGYSGDQLLVCTVSAKDISGVGEPSETRYQCEDGVLGGTATVSTLHSGYDGTGYVLLDAHGEYVTLTVAAAISDTYDLVIRYSHGHVSAGWLGLTVNGVYQEVPVPPTATWDDWTTVRVTVDLLAGANAIILADSNISIQVDCVDVVYGQDWLLEYVVEAVEGPVNGSWAKFFDTMFTPAPTAVQAAVSEMLVVLVPSSETWSWSESAPVTAHACFVADGATLANGGSFPC